MPSFRLHFSFSIFVTSLSCLFSCFLLHWLQLFPLSGSNLRVDPDSVSFFSLDYLSLPLYIMMELQTISSRARREGHFYYKTVCTTVCTTPKGDNSENCKRNEVVSLFMGSRLLPHSFTSPSPPYPRPAIFPVGGPG